MKKLLFISGYGALNKQGLIKNYENELNLLIENFELSYIDEYSTHHSNVAFEELEGFEEINIVVRDYTNTSIAKNPEIPDTCSIKTETLKDKTIYTLTGTCLDFTELFKILGIK